MNKLTKAQEKRWEEFITDFSEADIVGDGDEIKQHLAIELALQREEISKEIGHQNAGGLCSTGCSGAKIFQECILEGIKQKP